MIRIVVIDDEPLVRSTASTILTREGFTVETAEDGEGGLALVHANQPDAVITDIFMPKMDGIEIIMQMKRRSPSTKIIAVTGGGQAGMTEIASAAKHLGADHILHKPFNQASLLASVNAVLGIPPATRQPDA